MIESFQDSVKWQAGWVVRMKSARGLDAVQDACAPAMIPEFYKIVRNGLGVKVQVNTVL
jgi:hypothetical protein